MDGMPGRVTLMRLLRGPGAPAPYQQIRQILREEILTSKRTGERIAPERELAKRFGANRATISRAISALVREGLLVRRVGCGTFVSDGEEAPSQAKTSIVGLVVPYISGTFPSETIRSAIRRLREHDYKAVLFDSADLVTTEAEELERVAREGLDGALVMPVPQPTNIPLFDRVRRLGLPLVFVDRMPIGLEGDLVCTDHFGGAYEATSRLIKRGHKRIAHFTVLIECMSSAIEQRRRGYEQALIDHGIEVDPELICPPAYYRDHTLYFKHAVAYLHAMERPVTAVFCLYCQFVLSTVEAATALGIKVPEDLEVSGFLDANYHSLENTSILKLIQDQERIGEMAADLLISRIDGTGPEGRQEILVPPTIVDPLSEA